MMQASFIPFLKAIVDNDPENRDKILQKLIQVMWGLMEVSQLCMIEFGCFEDAELGVIGP